MDNRFSFTIAALKAVQCPADSDRTYVYDARTPGLAFCRTAKGAQSFYLYRRIGGRPVRLRLGGFPDITIEQARDMAAEKNGDIARGIDPQQQKQREREEWTLGQLFDWFFEHHSKVHKKTWKEDEERFDRHLDGWRNRKLKNISRADVQALHAKLGTTKGPYAANRILSLLHVMFEKGVTAGWEGGNPASGVQRFREQQRERFLQADEVPAFFKALAEEPNEWVRDFVYLTLLTGARKSNVMAMRWEDVHLVRAVWTIPDNKSGSPVSLPLVPTAVAILTRRKASAGVSPWVFPGRGKSGHLVHPSEAWGRILGRANLSDLWIHDLRRTLGSWQAAAGASLPIIGKSLGHKNQRSTAIYARLNIDPVRESVETATSALLLAGAVKMIPDKSVE
jgi:integrase